MSTDHTDPGAPVYGLLSISGVDIALALGMLREVIPAPSHYQPVPYAGSGLLGTIVLRDLIIPVADLAGRFGAAAGEGAADPVIAIVVQGQRVLGLLADEVKGLLRLPDSRLQRLATNASDRPLFSACFDHPDTHVVTSVLDGEALFALPGIATTTQAASATDRTMAVTGERRVDDDQQTIMLFDVGGTLLALDVSVVAMVLPAVHVEPSVLDGAVCRGVMNHLDVQVPVADPLALVGLGSLDAKAIEQAVLLQLPRGYVALALTEMHAVVRMRRTELQRLSALAVAQPHRFSGVLDVEGRQYLVLDREVLETDTHLDTLSALNTLHPDATPARAGGATAADDSPDDEVASRAGATYLTFDVGSTVATPLAEVVEILGYPAELIASGRHRSEVLGTFVHRGIAVPLVDLAQLLGPAVSAPITPASPVLMVQHGNETVGYVVGALHAIEPSIWETAPDDPAASSVGGSRLRSAPLIEIGADGDQRLVPRVSLLALTAELLGCLDHPAVDPVGTDAVGSDAG